MSTALSTTLDSGFGAHLSDSFDAVCAAAQELADANGSPVGIWARDGWYTACDVAPDLLEPQPELFGWRLDAVVDPWECDECGKDVRP